MPEERRYRDEEVREIFEAAARQEIGGPPASPEAQGLTLVDLQEIGREIGLEPTAVTRAAAALEVGRSVALPRPLSDSEWERLVAELRTTFGARGSVVSRGGLREWVNGNLYACIEPADAGYRLRLGTRKGGVAMLNLLGGIGVVTGAIAFGALLMSRGLQGAVFVPWMISASGIAAVMANALRLPRWARERGEQMERVAAKVDAMLAGEGAANEWGR